MIDSQRGPSLARSRQACFGRPNRRACSQAKGSKRPRYCYPPDKIQWMSVNKTNHTIHWKAIYPVDSVIYLSNNPGQICKYKAEIMSSNYRRLFLHGQGGGDINLSIHA